MLKVDIECILETYASKCCTILYLYRARIVGGSDTHSSSDLIEILKQWQYTDGTFVYTEKMRRRVWVDKSCPLHIDSLTAANCEAN